MPHSVATFLMFDGVAEKAMNLYVSIFPETTVTRLEKYAAGEQGAVGSIKRAHVRLKNHDLMFFDSPVKHAFNFTPSISLFVECESESEQAAAWEQLSIDGQVLMPLNNYGFSTRFGWVNDRFGVSWQLNLQ